MTVRISRVLAASLVLATAAGGLATVGAAIVTTNVSSPAPIGIADFGSTIASPLDVSDLRGTVTYATVTWIGFSHTYSLRCRCDVACTQRQADLLMSDSGGHEDVENLTLVFNAASAAMLRANHRPFLQLR